MPPAAANSRKRKHRPPQISDAEWVVMKVIWDKGPLTTNQVVNALDDRTNWKPKTIHTLLRRLAKKGALAFAKQGREHLFRPLVDAQHCRHAASRSFLHRLFDGELGPFLASFLEQEKLSRAEIEELKRILDEKKP